MATPAQIEANRGDAAKSTGPHTAERKATSALNALRYGLRSSRTLLPDEDAEQFRELLQAIVSRTNPK